MSQENVELVHRAYDAMGRQDLDAYLALHDPNCVIAPRIVSVEGRRAYRGYDGLRAFWTDINASFAEWAPQIEKSHDFDDTAIVKFRFRGRGRDSAVMIDDPAWLAVRFRAGRISWWATYGSEAEALEAVGLSEEDTHAER
jgi:ketosteroid isomerase-like protein